jgi:hypothetical protein
MSCKGFKKIPSQVADTRHSGDLTHQERLNYVSAVLCLQHLPPRTPANVSAGARSRVSTWENRADIEAEAMRPDAFHPVRRLHRDPHPEDIADSLYRQLPALASLVHVFI